MRSVLALLPLIPALATAFLIPPNLEVAAKKAEELFESGAVPFAQSIGFDPFHQSIKLECKGCAYKVAEMANVQLYVEAPNSLVLDFVGNQHEAFDLKLNDHDIFRMSPTSRLPLKVKQVRDDAGESSDLEVQLGYEFFIETIAPGIRTVRVHITSVDGVRTPRDMDIVELTVFQNSNGVLYLAKAGTRSPTPNEASVVECKFNLICRWKAYFADKIKSIRPMIGAGRKGGKGCHGRPSGNHTEGIPHPHGGHKGEHRPHGHHHGHHKHPFMWFSKAVIVGVMFLSAGVFAGFFVSLLGLLAGQFAIMAYRFATGKPICCARTAEVAVEAEEEGLLNEKMAQDDEELPAYTDSEGVIRGDEKIEL